ncbi:MAG: cyclase family protein [Alphaproteobacteria bacterium]
MAHTLGMVLLAAFVFTLATDQAAAEDTWYPSRYGAKDTIGALNLLDKEDTLRGASLIREGKVYALGGVTGRTTPAFGHRSFQLFLYPHGNGSGEPRGPNGTTFNDDFMMTWLGIGTQIDGFAHGGRNHRYYNGRTVDEVFGPKGAKLFGTHQIPPIATRGVLINMAAHFGMEMMEAGTAFNRTEIDAAAKAQGVTIAEGDVVLFHTGWQSLAETDPERFLAGEPGLGADGARYLASLGVVAVGADTFGLDVIPFETPADGGTPDYFPAHQILLAESGVHILENIQTADLAGDGATHFFFVLGVPRFQGAVQMVINPIAIR